MVLLITLVHSFTLSIHPSGVVLPLPEAERLGLLSSVTACNKEGRENLRRSYRLKLLRGRGRGVGGGGVHSK